jgi:insulysin
LDHYEFVIQAFFVWLKYIKNVYSSPGVWETMATISEFEFLYMTEPSLEDDASTFVSNLQKYPWEFAYSGGLLIQEKDDVEVLKMIKQITIKNAIVMISSPNFSNSKSKDKIFFQNTDYFYGTKYSEFKYSSWKTYDLENPPLIKGKLYMKGTKEFIDYYDFEIPSSNEYIPKDLEMVCPDSWFIVRMQPHFYNDCSNEAFKADGEDIVTEKLLQNQYGELWFKQDRSFFKPQANINIRLETNKGRIDIGEATKMFFFESMLAEWIIENLFDALLMSYSFEFSATNNGLEFTVSGYNDKIAELTKQVLESFRQLNMTKSYFKRVKDKFISDLNSEKMSKPYELAFKFMRKYIKEYGYSFDEMIKAGAKITLQDIISFHDQLFDEVYIKILVHGNMKPSSAMQLKYDIDKILNVGILK